MALRRYILFMGLYQTVKDSSNAIREQACFISCICFAINKPTQQEEGNVEASLKRKAVKANLDRFPFSGY